MMDGVLCINKPQGFTSFDVIAKMRGIAKTKKIGHSGTLDPMATGVLPLLFGKATKACDLLPISKKSYLAGFRFGLSTDTQDTTGTILNTDATPVSEDALLTVMNGFLGDSMQIPPMYSAVKVNGQKLYQLARQGQVIEREPRPITIDEISLVSYDASLREGVLSVTCSKGTYIRTLINDIGSRLSTGGVMSSLVRTMSADFTLDDCITLEEAEALSQAGQLEQKLIPSASIFRICPAIHLNSHQERLFSNGVRLDLNRVDAPAESCLCSVFGADGSFLAVARPDLEHEELRLVSFF